MKDVQKNYGFTVRVILISSVKAILYLGVVNKFQSSFGLYFLVWVKFGISDLHITLFSYAE